MLINADNNRDLNIGRTIVKIVKLHKIAQHLVDET